ncbi:hypothetical protein IFO70_09615 [Phormidium tenue FACHB-886]|nr:hypothetical protein [Phormidium tenue FACHB-886]
MRSPSLVLINDSHLFVSGDVVIHPTAAIASGVLLQADPGCRIVVEAGVCVGSGSILHANQGNLVIEAGATLGSGILIVGSSTVGANACIGSFTTILNCSVEPKQFISAESLLGDRSRQLEPSTKAQAQTDSHTHSQTHAQATADAKPTDAKPAEKPADRNGSTATSHTQLDSPWASPSTTPAATAPPPAPAENRNGSQPPQPTPEPPPTAPAQQIVYGRAYMEKMMIRMFPQRQALDPPPDPDSS